MRRETRLRDVRRPDVHGAPKQRAGSAVIGAVFWIFAIALMVLPFLGERQSSVDERPDWGRVEDDFLFAADVAAFDEEFAGEFDTTLAAHIAEGSEQWFALDSATIRSGEVVDPDRLESGRAAYEMHCVGCHDPSGDGGGPAARYLNPRPRNFRKGIFKFTSTDSGARPLREDLFRTITRGLAGSSMPEFRLVPEELRWSLVEYVRFLAIRGEFEQMAIDLAWDDEELPDLDEVAEIVLGRWSAEKLARVLPGEPEGPNDADSVARGRALFLDTAGANCVACHGPTGRGDGPTAGDYLDDWGYPIRPRDFTAGVFRAGSTPEDLYRSIATGINGTPMIAFGGALEPQQIWDIVHFVQSLSRGAEGDR